MFESVVAGVLEKYLGNYVDGLDGKQLKISVLGGSFQIQVLDADRR